jgi:hypothetical protein
MLIKYYISTTYTYVNIEKKLNNSIKTLPYIL